PPPPPLFPYTTLFRSAEVRGLPHVHRVAVARRRACLADLHQEGPVGRELQDLIISTLSAGRSDHGAAVPGQPNVVVLVDVDAVFRVGPLARRRLTRRIVRIVLGIRRTTPRAEQVS